MPVKKPTSNRCGSLRTEYIGAWNNQSTQEIIQGPDDKVHLGVMKERRARVQKEGTGLRSKFSHFDETLQGAGGDQCSM